MAEAHGVDISDPEIKHILVTSALHDARRNDPAMASALNERLIEIAKYESFGKPKRPKTIKQFKAAEKKLVEKAIKAEEAIIRKEAIEEIKERRAEKERRADYVRLSKRPLPPIPQGVIPHMVHIPKQGYQDMPRYPTLPDSDEESEEEERLTRKRRSKTPVDIVYQDERENEDQDWFGNQDLEEDNPEMTDEEYKQNVLDQASKQLRQNLNTYREPEFPNTQEYEVIQEEETMLPGISGIPVTEKVLQQYQQSQHQAEEQERIRDQEEHDKEAKQRELNTERLNRDRLALEKHLDIVNTEILNQERLDLEKRVDIVNNQLAQSVLPQENIQSIVPGLAFQKAILPPPTSINNQPFMAAHRTYRIPGVLFGYTEKQLQHQGLPIPPPLTPLQEIQHNKAVEKDKLRVISKHKPKKITKEEAKEKKFREEMNELLEDIKAADREADREAEESLKPILKLREKRYQEKPSKRLKKNTQIKYI